MRFETEPDFKQRLLDDWMRIKAQWKFIIEISWPYRAWYEIKKGDGGDPR